ncbi:hypothetical protein F5Y03DRAFT_391657 [Xylaria venustula]|nr:hypothetical protein F5Y03DRAFT_391657 [Xylaria venustula]
MEGGEDEEDASDTSSSQFAALSDRAAIRSVARPGTAPLTASSPEFDGALEDTNTLIRIINAITLNGAMFSAVHVESRFSFQTVENSSFRSIPTGGARIDSKISALGSQNFHIPAICFPAFKKCMHSI